MARFLTHTHSIVSDSPDSAHVDSYGRSFGGAEHAKVANVKSWPDTIRMKSLEHRHADVREDVHDESKMSLLVYAPNEDDSQPVADVATATGTPDSTVANAPKSDNPPMTNTVPASTETATSTTPKS